MRPKIYPPSEHTLDLNLIDSDALYVMQRLRDAGFHAYLVGGSVRDLLTKRSPKDYDISTSALPEEVKRVFQRQCILIGRRFRLAHIRFGHKIIEVSTFRSGESEEELIVQDNVWGTPEEDVLRRDFTINGLFYDSATQSIIDYVGGWEDIKKGILRSIGNSNTRFKQDPVRMIRLLKFRARFGFEIDTEARDALLECRHEIIKSSPARVLEEVFRMLESGAAAPFFMLLLESGMLELLLPPLSHFLQGPKGAEIFKYLAIADKINKNSPKTPIDRALLMACLLFPILETEIAAQYLAHGTTPHIGDLMLLTSDVIRAVVSASFSHFPRRISSTAGFILATQFRLTPFSNKRHPRPKLMRMKEFNLALKFLKIRALVNESLFEAYHFWQNLHRNYEHHGEHRKGHHHHHHAPHPKKSISNDQAHAQSP